MNIDHASWGSPNKRMFEKENLFPTVPEAYPNTLLASVMQLLDLNSYLCGQLSFVRKNLGDKIVFTIKTIEDILISYERPISNDLTFFNNLHPHANPAKDTLKYWKEVDTFKKSFFADCDRLHNDLWCADAAKAFTELFINYAPWSMDAAAHLPMAAIDELMARPDLDPFLNPAHVCWDESAVSFFAESESLSEEISASINEANRTTKRYFDFWDNTQPETLTEATTRFKELENSLERLSIATRDHKITFENWDELSKNLLQKVSSKFKF